MSTLRSNRVAWLALFASPVLWALHHQLGSNVAFAACERGSARVAAIAGIAALLIIGLIGTLAWRAWRRAGGTLRASAERLTIFIPLLGWMSAALFGLTIAAQLLADLLLPPCFG